MGEFYALSAIADLQNLSLCSGLVGKFSSEFIITAWMLAVGQHSKDIPIFDLRGEKTAIKFNEI